MNLGLVFEYTTQIRHDTKIHDTNELSGLFNILTFLPVISLLRCKSVYKTWLSIISNPQFTQTHLIQSRKIPSYVLSIVDKSIYIDTREDSTLVYVLKFFDWQRIVIVCSCDGLVCVSNCATDFMYLGNPMTRQFRKLPPPSEQLDCGEFLLGFGFDDVSNDYKILRISVVLEQEDDDEIVCALQAVEMYSANNDSWKEIQIPETLKYFSISRSVCVNLKGSRVLYFEGTHELLSFDLHDEVFRLYPYPISPLQYEQRKSSVLDFEGSVAMIFNESTNESVLGLWTLNEVPGNWSRTREFNLDDNLKKIPLPRLYLGDGHFFTCVFGEYTFHDYKKKHVKKFLDQTPYARNLTLYNETLVSIRGFEQSE